MTFLLGGHKPEAVLPYMCNIAVVFGALQHVSSFSSFGGNVNLGRWSRVHSCKDEGKGVSKDGFFTLYITLI